MGLQLHYIAVREPAELDWAFSAMTQARANALLVFGDPLFLAQRTRLAELAAQHRLPAIYTATDYGQAGGLMSYTANPIERERRAAVYLDKILKETKPADLPVE